MPLPLIPLLMLGGSAGSSILGGLLGRKTATPKFSADETRLMNKSENMADDLGAMGQDLFDSSISAFGPAQSFYERILGGDRSALTELMAPEVGTILSQYDTAKQNAMRYAPRGGGRNSTLAAAETGKASDIARLIAGMRPAAAEGLKNMGSQLGYMGLGATGQAQGALETLSRMMAVNKSGAQQNAASMGAGIGQLAATLLGEGLRRMK